MWEIGIQYGNTIIDNSRKDGGHQMEDGIERVTNLFKYNLFPKNQFRKVRRYRYFLLWGNVLFFSSITIIIMIIITSVIGSEPLNGYVTIGIGIVVIMTIWGFGIRIQDYLSEKDDKAVKNFIIQQLAEREVHERLLNTSLAHKIGCEKDHTKRQHEIEVAREGATRVTHSVSIRDSVIQRSNIGNINESYQRKVKFCPECGNPLNLNDYPKYCPECGNPL